MPTYEGPTGCNVLRDMWLNVRDGFEPAQGDKLIAAIVDYVFTGVEPTWLPKPCGTHMAALMPSLRKYRTAAANGMRNGRAADVPFSTDYDPAARGHRKRGRKTDENRPKISEENGTETHTGNGPEKQAVALPLAGETLTTGIHRTQDRTAQPTPAQGCPQYVIRNTEQGQVTEREAGGATLLVSRAARDARRAGEPAAAPLEPPRNMADAIGFNMQLGAQLRATS